MRKLIFGITALEFPGILFHPILSSALKLVYF